MHPFCIPKLLGINGGSGVRCADLGSYLKPWIEQGNPSSIPYDNLATFLQVKDLEASEKPLVRVGASLTLFTKLPSFPSWKLRWRLQVEYALSRWRESNPYPGFDMFGPSSDRPWARILPMWIWDGLKTRPVMNGPTLLTLLTNGLISH